MDSTATRARTWEADVDVKIPGGRGEEPL